MGFFVNFVKYHLAEVSTEIATRTKVAWNALRKTLIRIHDDDDDDDDDDVDESRVDSDEENDVKRPSEKLRLEFIDDLSNSKWVTQLAFICW